MKRKAVSCYTGPVNSDLPLDIIRIVVEYAIQGVSLKEIFYLLFQLSCLNRTWHYSIEKELLPDLAVSLKLLQPSLWFTNWLIRKIPDKFITLKLTRATAKSINIEDIHRLTRLKSLILYGNYTKPSFKEIVQLTQLDNLTLFFNNDAIHVDKEFTSLNNLRTLELNSTDLSISYDEFHAMSNLRNLVIDRNDYIRGQDIIGAQLSLETLCIAGNNRSLNICDIGKLTNLTSLKLSRFEQPFSNNILDLTRLKELEIDYHMYYKVLSSFTSIEKLVIGNYTKARNFKHYSLPLNLTELVIMDRCGIAPEHIIPLKKLRRLDIRGDSHITDKTLKELPSLTELNIGTDLPLIDGRVFNDLTQLESLSITGNISMNLSSVVNIRNLRALCLEKNHPMIPVLEEVYPFMQTV